MELTNIHSLNSSNRSFKLSWKSKVDTGSTPQQEFYVRTILSEEARIDWSHANNTRSSDTWSRDVDPDPFRILRKSGTDPWGDSVVMELRLDPITEKPLSSKYTRNDGEVLRETSYQDGELVEVVERRPWTNPATIEEMHIKVNPDGTLSYTETERQPYEVSA